MWQNSSSSLPVKDKIVNVKIDDDKGIRNECKLKFNGKFWIDESDMYVYWTPTHWCYIDEENF